MNDAPQTCATRWPCLQLTLLSFSSIFFHVSRIQKQKQELNMVPTMVQSCSKHVTNTIPVILPTTLWRHYSYFPQFADEESDPEEESDLSYTAGEWWSPNCCAPRPLRFVGLSLCPPYPLLTGTCYDEWGFWSLKPHLRPSLSPPAP